LIETAPDAARIVRPEIRPIVARRRSGNHFPATAGCILVSVFLFLFSYGYEKIGAVDAVLERACPAADRAAVVDFPHNRR